MGFLKFLSPVMALFGGDDEENIAPAASNIVAKDTAKTADQIAQEKRQKSVTRNAGAQQQSSPLLNDEDNVTKKTLLGL